MTDCARRVFHDSLPAYLSNELLGSTKRESLVESGLIKLSDRRQELVDKLFKEVQNKENKLTAFSLLLITVGLTLETQGNLGPFSRRTDFIVAYCLHCPQGLNYVSIALQFSTAFHYITIFLFFNKSKFYCSTFIKCFLLFISYIFLYQ